MRTLYLLTTVHREWGARNSSVSEKARGSRVFSGPELEPVTGQGLSHSLGRSRSQTSTDQRPSATTDAPPPEGEVCWDVGFPLTANRRNGSALEPSTASALRAGPPPPGPQRAQRSLTTRSPAGARLSVAAYRQRRHCPATAHAPALGAFSCACVFPYRRMNLPEGLGRAVPAFSGGCRLRWKGEVAADPGQQGFQDPQGGFWGRRILK